MKTISFQVSDEIAAIMTQQTVYLDVFGVVRWHSDESPVFVNGHPVPWRAS